MGNPRWSLRPARRQDRDFLLGLNAATIREHVERVWGWDDKQQQVFFDERFQPDLCRIIQAGGEDIGVLIVEERLDEIYLAEIEILPQWQGRGIGTSIVRALMEDAATSGKPLTLRVLHVNERARALYERLGFRPFMEIETHCYLRWDG